VFSLQAWYKKYFTPQKMMRTVLLSTLLPILFGIYLYGWRVLALLLVVTAAGVATEFLFQRHYKKKSQQVEELL
jgi:Na+-transporting NADH:ubiquinone oxidoreductase subunit B